MSQIKEIIAEIETDLGLRPGFFSDLKKDDDWSFLIKVHALMESVCSHLLSLYFSDTKFKDIFSLLEMSDTKKGKIAFLRASGLINKEEARFIRGLSELRNKMVHKIEGIHFKFSDYITKLDKQQRNSFVNTFGYAYFAEENHVLNDHELNLSDPKNYIWWGVAIIQAIIKLQVDTRFFNEQATKSKLRMYELIESDNSDIQ